MRGNYTKQIRENFAVVSDLYAELWGEYFHLAWFARDDEDLETSFERTHHRYLHDARVAEAEWIIDLACGPGKFSAHVAEHTQGHILGIDLSEAQLAKARRYTRDNLTFLQGNIMHVDALRQRFDAAFLLDAACYLPNRMRALKGIARVLTPRGRLLIADWLRAERVNWAQRSLLLEPLIRYWRFSSLDTLSHYQTMLTGAGFEVICAEDVTERVRKNWDHGYAKATTVLQRFGSRELLRRLSLKDLLLRGGRQARILKESGKLLEVISEARREDGTLIARGKALLMKVGEREAR